MARHAVCLSLLHESNKKKAYFHEYFEVFFSIADSYDCVKTLLKFLFKCINIKLSS